MKNNTRLISAILAAVLCGASLAACANNPTPPVTDVTTDTPATVEPVTTVTADAPATEAPATDTSSETAQTTDVPATDTQAVPTDAPVITEEPIVTTGAPVTTAPITSAPTTTDAPVTTCPDSPVHTPEVIQTKKIKELLYLTDDGYIKILGAEKIKLPTAGKYYSFDNDSDLLIFSSETLQVTEASEDVSATDGTNSPHGIYVKNDRFCISYLIDSKYVEIEVVCENFQAFYGDTEVLLNASKYTLDTYNISPNLSVFSFSTTPDDAYIVTIFNKTEVCNVAKVGMKISSICYRTPSNGYAVTYGSSAGSSCTTGIYVTCDEGRSFQFSPNSPHPFAWNSKICFISDASFFYSSPSAIFADTFSAPNNPLKTYECRSIFENKTFNYVFSALTGYENTYGKSFETMTPFFEGMFGACAIKNHFFSNDEYIYFITIDGGLSWTLYSPTVFFDDFTPTTTLLPFKHPPM